MQEEAPDNALSDLATLKGWPVAITVADMVCGALLSGAVASLAVCITRHLA